MSVYGDTSFFCSLYRRQVFTEVAVSYREILKEPLPYTTLLEFEFVQAIRLQVWLNKADHTKGYGQKEADQMLANWAADKVTGINVLVPCDMDLVMQLAQSYSQQRTTQHGHRTLDILHVATAVHLGAKTFLTFDSRQRALARYLGLKTPL
jgi:predicted nucleic acid-binding protein